MVGLVVAALDCLGVDGVGVAVVAVVVVAVAGGCMACLIDVGVLDADRVRMPEVVMIVAAVVRAREASVVVPC